MKITLQSNIPFSHHLRVNSQVYSYTLSWNNKDVTEDSKIAFSWEVPLKDIFYRWYPGMEDSRGIIADWDEDALTESSIATNAPIICFYNQKGENKCTVAISEFKKLTYMNFGVNEKAATLHCYVALPLLQFANAGTFETTFQIRIDEDPKPLETTIGEVSQWWESFLTVAKAPEYATDTVYSFWYSYHQDITPEVVEKECRAVQALGIKTVIVDDGWQTTDNNGGYAFCGDWKPLKFPNMKEHVARVHAMGLKYILWYSVPFLGLKAENYPIFKDKTLFETRGAAVLDPRYKEVREYLIGTYETALREWDLDGFKLDFIDEFVNKNNIPANDSMDIKDLSDAVFTLMTDIRTRLKQIKESVVVEFRQTYIGPAMRSYGDFFRVGDCPNDLMKNRWNSVDLRLLCRNTPIHSDMLMWHREETVENCALQIINALFSVLQISLKLEEQTQEQKKMLRFWLDFVKVNKPLLLYSPLKVHDMQSLYTLVEGIGTEEKLSVVFVPDKCVTVDKPKVILVNGTQSNTIIAEFDGQYTCEILNCMGEKTGSFEAKYAGIFRIPVPSAGVMVAKKENKKEKKEKETMKRILFQGDSITDCGRIRATDENKGRHLGFGYAALVAADLGNREVGAYEFLNLGLGGSKILDVYNHMIQDIIEIAPDYMSIMVGVNDAINHLETKRFESLYQWLIDDVKAALPNIKIMILSAFCDEWSEQKFPGVNKDVNEKVAVTQQLAERNKLPFLNTQEILDKALKEAPLGYWTAPDGIHPTVFLHKRIADAWIKTFLEELK